MTLGNLREIMKELLSDFPNEAVVSFEREDADNYLVVRAGGRELVAQVTT